jgi:hypothetical protein
MDLFNGREVLTLFAGAVPGAILGQLLPYLKKVFASFGEQALKPIARVDITTRFGRKAFKASQEVYGRLPRAMQDDPEDVRIWLLEVAKTELWQEIYLVSRSLGNINGVLYASFYPKYKCDKYEGPMCVINALSTKAGLAHPKALIIKHKLWKRLQREMSKYTLKANPVYHHFFEVLDPQCLIGSYTYDEEDERNRRYEYIEFLNHIHAKQVWDNYRLPDLETLEEARETPAMLYHLGPTEPGDEQKALNFMYGFHYFSEFNFGEDLTNIDDLVARVKYLRSLIKRTSLGAALPSTTS